MLTAKTGKFRFWVGKSSSKSQKKKKKKQNTSRSFPTRPKGFVFNYII